MFFLLDNIYIKFDFIQNVGIPMGTNFGPLVANMFLFRYERDFTNAMIYAFNSSPSYLDDLLNIDKISFKKLVQRICHYTQGILLTPKQHS